MPQKICYLDGDELPMHISMQEVHDILDLLNQVSNHLNCDIIADVDEDQYVIGESFFDSFEDAFSYCIKVVGH